MRLKTSTEARPVVAVVASSYSDIRKSVIDHMAQRLDHAGYGVLCVAGREVQLPPGTAPASLKFSHSLYSLATEYDVQGIIVFSFNLGSNVPDSVIRSLIRGFSGKPLVSLGLAVPGVPSLSVDNRRCMRKLMLHMTCDPSRRRFVFIRGCPLMTDSIEREDVFREVLAERGLSVDERLIINGEFSSSPAFNAMDRLLKQTRQIDAVVAANDVMAVSAIHALTKHGLSVPGDVIVSGFDNRPEAMESNPPVTTISHHHISRSDAAVNQLLRLMQDSTAADELTLPELGEGELLVRASSERTDASPADQDASASAFNRNECREYLRSSLTGAPPPELEIDRVIDEVIKLLVYGSTLCEDYLLPALQQLHARPRELRWWRMLSHQIGIAGRHFGSSGLSPDALPRMSSLQSRILGTVWSVQEEQRFSHYRYLQRQDALHQDLTTSTNLHQIHTALRRALEEFGVLRAYIVLYQTPAEQPDRQGKLSFILPQADESVAARQTAGAWRRTQPKAVEPPGKPLNEEPFPTRKVLPDNLRHELGRGLLVQAPLITGQWHYGYLLIDPSTVEPLNILNLAISLSNAVCHCSRLRFLEAQTVALGNLNRELTRLANFDPLTGLSNRSQFQRLLEQRFHEADMAGTGVALLFLDVDGFKLVNDTLGHSMGDKLLMEIAARLGRLLRPGDTAARLSGDEFTVIISDTRDQHLPLQIATLLLRSLSEPFTLSERTITLTVSIGLAMYPQHGVDVETLLAHADAAMYQAKAMGKNCLCQYSHDLDRSAAARLQIDQAMRSGLADGEFRVCYQPRVDLRSGEISAFEALLRWVPHSQVELVDKDRADTFITLAEQTGFIMELDSFALESACAQARQWREQGLPVRIAVNMSVNQLQRTGIVERVKSALARHQLDPACIEIELTESAVMTDVENNILKLTALRELGMKISVDDFGTGHSSLNYLKRLPVTSLKIDRSFVTDSTKVADVAIMEAIVALGKSMGFRLIAEGVESAGQCRYVAELGCDEAQGFFYARALEAQAATQFLRDSRKRLEEA